MVRMRCLRQLAGMQDSSRGHRKSREELGLIALQLTRVRPPPLPVKNLSPQGPRLLPTTMRSWIDWRLASNSAFMKVGRPSNHDAIVPSCLGSSAKPSSPYAESVKTMHSAVAIISAEAPGYLLAKSSPLEWVQESREESKSKATRRFVTVRWFPSWSRRRCEKDTSLAPLQLSQCWTRRRGRHRMRKSGLHGAYKRYREGWAVPWTRSEGAVPWTRSEGSVAELCVLGEPISAAARMKGTTEWHEA